MRHGAASIPERDLGDTVVMSCALCALAVMFVGLLRERPRVDPDAGREPTKVAQAPLVRLESASLRSATATQATPAPASVPKSPSNLRPIPSLPSMALPTLPALPVAAPQGSEQSDDRPVQSNPTGSTEGKAIGLTMGIGEGHQPWPDYPAESLRRREDGAVTVRFSVAPSGEVSQARVAGSSGWPRLDQAATATILRSWKFPAGGPREYEVTIQFQIR